MKKMLKKILLISLLFSATVPATMQANFNWTTLSNGAAKIGSKTVNWLTTNSGKAFSLLRNYPVVTMGAVAVIAFAWYKLKSAKQQRELNLLEARENNRNIEEIRQALAKEEADVNQQDEFSGKTLLMKSVGTGNLELVQSLITKNADPNLQCNKGRTALMNAALVAKNANYSGNVEKQENTKNIIRLLLNAGADPFIKAKDGSTVLDQNNAIMNEFR